MVLLKCISLKLIKFISFRWNKINSVQCGAINALINGLKFTESGTSSAVVQCYNTFRGLIAVNDIKVNGTVSCSHRKGLAPRSQENELLMQLV